MPLQSQKILLGIVITLLGILKEVTLLQLLKAPLHNSLIPSGIVYAPLYDVGKRANKVELYTGAVKPSQLVKAEALTVVTLLGILMVVTFLQFWKALLHISLIPSGTVYAPLYDIGKKANKVELYTGEVKPLQPEKT